MGFRAGCPRMGDLSMYIILNWKQLRPNKFRKNYLGRGPKLGRELLLEINFHSRKAYLHNLVDIS